MILSYNFLKFHHYLCLRGREIHCWYSYWATMFEWPRKSGSTSGSRATQRYWWLCLIDFHNFFIIYVFDYKESISDIPAELTCSGDLENLDQLPVQEVLMILSYKFLKFLQYLCFRGQGIHCWHSFRATSLKWPQKSGSTSGSRATQRYWWLCLTDFPNIFTIYVFKVRESFSDISTELSCSGDLENPGQLPVLEVFEVTKTK
jgi:uncharacterized membrane protein YhaH (DUF805 family)